VHGDVPHLLLLLLLLIHAAVLPVACAFVLHLIIYIHQLCLRQQNRGAGSIQQCFCKNGSL
jgi:hypothetical protein